MEDLQLRGQPMKKVEDFTYLSSVVTSDGKKYRSLREEERVLPDRLEC